MEDDKEWRHLIKTLYPKRDMLSPEDEAILASGLEVVDFMQEG